MHFFVPLPIPSNNTACKILLKKIKAADSFKKNKIKQQNKPQNPPKQLCFFVPCQIIRKKSYFAANCNKSRSEEQNTIAARKVLTELETMYYLGPIRCPRCSGKICLQCFGEESSRNEKTLYIMLYYNEPFQCVVQ